MEEISVVVTGTRAGRSVAVEATTSEVGFEDSSLARSVLEGEGNGSSKGTQDSSSSKSSPVVTDGCTGVGVAMILRKLILLFFRNRFNFVRKTGWRTVKQSVLAKGYCCQLLLNLVSYKMILNSVVYCNSDGFPCFFQNLNDVVDFPFRVVYDCCYCSDWITSNT